MEEQKSAGYYAIIPASVRYDEHLSANAKLLYGEITALANQKGYCWATNSYFAKLYRVDKRTVTRWVGELVHGSHIKVVIKRDAMQKVVERRMVLTAIPPPTVLGV